MSISAPFVRRPVGTSLLTIALALAGGIAFFFLPVAPLPQVDSPTISVNASLPGASPDTMASSVATPLERQLGRIAGITEMTSSSSLGQTSITLQFDLSRNIDAAGRDVQAAINAARSNLPSNLPGNPTYRKVNPADSPIMLLAITSDTYTHGQMYDAASSILEQKISQLSGIGQVIVGGGALPAVRVDVNPILLNNMGLTLEDVRTALGAANANQAKGQFISDNRTWLITDTDQLMKADQYKPLIVAWRNGAPVRLSDIANVQDSVEDIRQGGIVNGKPAILLILFRQPGANIIATVDGVMAMVPQLQADIPAGMHLAVVMERTSTIRASVHDVEISLLISLALVVLVVFAFLREIRATIIPGLAVPISLIGTFGVMYLAGYSLDNLSLMALTIATGFVVDDAIVVVENVSRHLEAGMPAMQAALQGAREIGFTVVSMSVSLVAVFIPILFMGGLVGRLLREFAVVLSTAIAVSMVVSLTTTPMMCALLLRPRHAHERSWLYRASEGIFNYILLSYETTLSWVLRHRFTMLLVTAATVTLTVYLYITSPRGFFPQQDTGRLTGQILADQSISFQAMSKLVPELCNIVASDPAVDGAMAFMGSGNSGRMFVSLKPLSQRKISADEVMERLRRPLSRVPGVVLTLQSVQDIRVGGRMSGGQYQYTLQGDSTKDLAQWTPILESKMKTLPGLVDVSSDQQDHGLDAGLTIDRDLAGRFNIQPKTIDNILYDAFGQRQVSTMYTSLNQYHVVMEAASQFWQNPDGLHSVYVPTPDGTLVPISAFAHYAPTITSLSINHQGQFPAMTISFNMLPGFALSQAVDEVQQAETDIGMPTTIHGSFQGTAQAYQSSTATEPLLILAALIAVYIVLGVLYESYIHPITILSTIPSAGVGALLALLLCKTDLSIIALIGIILLIGIVKKNAILMVDFALETERRGNKPPLESIYEACLLRLPPDHDDHHGRATGRRPPGRRHGRWRRAAATLGHRHHRRSDFQPDAHPVYNTRDLSLSRRVPAFPGAHLSPPAYARGGATMTIIPPQRHSRHRARNLVLALCVSGSLWLFSSCKVGPTYNRPPQHLPTTFKAATTQETTRPVLSSDWWKLFNDAELNTLEVNAILANPGLEAAMQRVEEARAQAGIAKSQLYPLVSFDPSFERRSRIPPGSDHDTTHRNASGTTITTTPHAHTGNTITLPIDLSYEVDIWGKIRRNYEAAKATAFASADDFQLVLQTLEADVASDYFALRLYDAEVQIFGETVESYRAQLQLTQQQFRAGLVGQTDIAQAETALDSTLTEQIEAVRNRENEQNALAILLGKPPAEFSVQVGQLNPDPPIIPAGLSGDLLERRPDVAEAEENLIAANAQIGVAIGSALPSLTLTGSAGFESFDVQHALNWSQRAWSFGPSISAPIFEGGLLKYGIDEAKAHYAELVATYRSSVLQALADVENSLVDLHRRAEEADAQTAAVRDSQAYLRYSNVEYRQGLISYLQIIDAERTLLINEVAAATILNERLTSTVLLIKALGGGWEQHRSTTQPHAPPPATEPVK